MKLLCPDCQYEMDDDEIIREDIDPQYPFCTRCGCSLEPFDDFEENEL